MNAEQCIARGVMPQVDERDIPELLTWLRQRGVVIVYGESDPRYVRGRQKVVRSKVRAMPEEVINKPTLISRDKLVIDGNHRWFKAYWLGWLKFPTITICLPFKEAIDEICSFPKTYYYDDGKFHPVVN